jgi:hypothetical protein
MAGHPYSTIRLNREAVLEVQEGREGVAQTIWV